MNAPKILISFPFVEGGGGWHIPLGAACVEALEALGFATCRFNPVVESETGVLWKSLERLAVLGGRAIGKPKAWTKSRLPWLEDARRYKGLVEAVRATKPDYLFVISTFNYPKDLLDQLRSEFGVKKLLCWCVEGPTWINDPNLEAELYDHYFCIHKTRISNPRIQYLPAVGFDPGAYGKLAGVGKKHDLVFVGRQKKRRVEWLSALSELKPELYGPGWDRCALRDLQVSDGIFGPELNRLYNETRIVLNVSAWSNHDLNCLNLRILDVPATGSLLLTDYAPDIEEYLKPDREVVIAHSPEEMLDKARYYLAHEAERERIALAGWERVQKMETYLQKMRRLLDTSQIEAPVKP